MFEQVQGRKGSLYGEVQEVNKFEHIRGQRCARFPKFNQNFSERQILWSLYSVHFHNLTLQLPIQTLYSVVPELQVFVSSLENCRNFSETSTPQGSSCTVGKSHMGNPWEQIDKRD